MAPVQCKIRFSVGTAKVSAEGERGLTAEGAWRRVTSVMRAPAPSQGQRETGASDVTGKLWGKPCSSSGFYARCVFCDGGM